MDSKAETYNPELDRTHPLNSVVVDSKYDPKEYKKGRALHQFLKRLPSLDSLKPRSGNMQTRATITTFMAAIQAQILSITVSQNDTALQVAVNVLGFSGLIMEILETVQLLEISVLLQWTEKRLRGYLKDLEDRPLEELDEFVQQMNNIQQYTRTASPPFRRTVLNEAAKVLIRRAKQLSDTDSHAQQANLPSQIPSLDLTMLTKEVRSMEPPPDLVELVALGDTLHQEWIWGDHINWWWLITTCQFLITVICFAATSGRMVIWLVTVIAFSILLIAILWARERMYEFSYKVGSEFSQWVSRA